MTTEADLFGGADPRAFPRYSRSEAARILNLPPSTLRAWTDGRVLDGRSDLRALIEPASGSGLSFENLVELHVLRGMRVAHHIPMKNVRAALQAVGDRFGTPRPLVSHDFYTDGRDLFVRELGKLEKLSNSEQLGMEEHLRLHLERVERDEGQIARRLFPYMSEDRVVVVDPRIAFGRPVIADTGVPVEILVERFDQGESLDDLAADYDLDVDKLRSALRAGVKDAA